MDQFQQVHQRNNSYDLPPLTNPPAQFFGGNGIEGSPTVPSFDFNDIQTDNGQDHEGLHDETNDAKRRRIARVGFDWLSRARQPLTYTVGLRYVPEEEDQV